MRIAEIFHSVQGEGGLTGTPSVFVRTTGCNLRCVFCDTPYTSWEPEGEQIAWQSVRDKVLGYDCRHAVLTGGEPLLQPELVPLTQALHDAGLHITIETAGTVYRPVHADLMSVSPKLSNSTPEAGLWQSRHEQARDNEQIASKLFDDFSCQLKFVVDKPTDLAEVDAYVARFPKVSADHVWLMPQGITVEELKPKEPWIKQAAADRGYHVSRRLHIELFGNTRGT